MAATKTVGQLEAELRELAQSAQDNLYRRLEVANKLSREDEFVSKFNGSLDRAHEHLKMRFFTDITTSSISFGRLLDMQRRLSVKVWREYQGDLAALEQVYRDKVGEVAEPALKGHRTSWKAECEKALEELRRVKVELRQAKDKARALAAEVERLQAETRIAADSLTN